MLSSIRLTNFRSYADFSLNLRNGPTVLVGPNGVGKTNVLEAVYVLANTKSFRARDSDLIRRDDEWFRIRGTLADEELSIVLDRREGRKNDKRLLHREQTVDAMTYIGRLPVVLFEPQSLRLVYGGPDERRAFLDVLLATVDSEYLRALIKYRRIIKQRNNLLRQLHYPQDEQLFAWDLKLVESATLLATARMAFVDYSVETAAQNYRALSGKDDLLSVSYSTKVDDEYPVRLLDQLTQAHTRDVQYGYTSVGPHRDDMIIKLRGRLIEHSASRGEIRSAILALKLVEMAYVHSRLKKYPLLLLDDVFSELDPGRQQFLLQAIANHQALITTTSLDFVPGRRKQDFELLRLGS